MMLNYMRKEKFAEKMTRWNEDDSQVVPVAAAAVPTRPHGVLTNPLYQQYVAASSRTSTGRVAGEALPMPEPKHIMLHIYYVLGMSICHHPELQNSFGLVMEVFKEALRSVGLDPEIPANVNHIPRI